MYGEWKRKDARITQNGKETKPMKQFPLLRVFFLANTSAVANAIFFLIIFVRVFIFCFNFCFYFRKFFEEVYVFQHLCSSFRLLAFHYGHWLLQIIHFRFGIVVLFCKHRKENLYPMFLSHRENISKKKKKKPKLKTIRKDETICMRSAK